MEKCKQNYLAQLKAIYVRFPEDYLVTRIYAKSLLLLHGTLYFALSLDEMMEDSDSKKQLDEAEKLVVELDKKHGYGKLHKNLTVFRLVGTSNFLGVSEMINLTRREIMKNTNDSWHTHLLRIYLADVFVQLEAVSSAVKELQTVEDCLLKQDYHKIPFGYLLMATCLVQKLFCMSKKSQKYEQSIRQTIAVAEQFLKDTSFTLRGVVITQKLHAALTLDPSVLPQYVAHAEAQSKTIL